MTRDEIEARFPHLIRALRWAACLTTGESVTCLQARMERREWASEAINHYGGVSAALAGAWRCRHAAREFALRRP